MTKLKEMLTRLSVARTEFRANNSSVLSSFVKPPFFEQINILNYEHSIALVGGRGSGKTMYLRYFSHWTQFGTDANPCLEDFKNIVLYWKPDTIFSRAIERRGLDSELSQNLFQVLISIELTKELIGLVDNVTKHFSNEVKDSNLEEDLVKIINRFYGISVVYLEDVSIELDLFFADFYRDILEGKSSKVIFTKSIVNALLTKLKHHPLFHSTSFKIYVDEFENLTINQQAFINALRKHSDNFISWNVAYKAYATVSNYVSEGLGEQLQKQNDYREVNIDKIIEETEKNDINSFFAKILLVTIDHRRYSEFSFQDSAELVKTILVQKNVTDLINNYAANNKGFFQRLSKVLESSSYNIDINQIKDLKKHPSLAVNLIAVKNQKNFELEKLNSYISNDLDDKEKQKFEEKIRHYTPSGIYKLNIISAYNEIPIYSGFERFIKLSSYNVRHFLELCYQTFLLHTKDVDNEKELELNDFQNVSAYTMHRAAQITSNKLLSEVTSFAPMGQVLNYIVQRLGELFRMYHQQDPITEPEINHFGITTDSLDKEIQDILNQALCWNVLIRHRVTKERNIIETNNYDYQLNPIYSPAFGISYRKLHKKKFSEKEINILFQGTNQDWILYRNFMEQKLFNNRTRSLLQAELF